MDGPDRIASHRLPTQVVPRRYDLELRPDLTAATFTGTATISVEVLEPVSSISLHALDLDIDHVEVESTSGHTWGIEATPTVTLDPDAEQIHLGLPGELPQGTAELRFEFRGTLNDLLVGFYRSTFSSTDPDTGEQVEHTIAVTQFESTHARRAFPCFDEPAFKAVFAISLVVPSHLLAVSNGAEVERVPVGDGLDRVRFADTISMSTYLVAFVVGPLEVTEPRMVAGTGAPIPLRVVHPPGSAHLCGFALDVAEAALQFFERYYELPYPGDKLDLVAVPDFAFGAMENLGCVTFREVLLLIDPETATQPELQRVADVINHELAHMWFGDLVTMSWWNGIWLNEAFATFMEVMATDAFRPDWDVWTTFGLARSAAFDTDALASTRPIEYEVVTAADAEGMFDILTYEKGASVVRMLEQYLGPDEFRRGIAAYLREHAYGNTDTTDLWDALEASTGEPVRRIMDHWIFRGGHPLVTVTVADTGLSLDQERFRYAGTQSDDSAPPRSGDEPWPVPMVVRTSSNGATAEHRVLLDGPTRLELGEAPTTVQPNVAGNGFYRAALTDELRQRLAATPPANALERFVLVDDTWAAFLAERLPISSVVDLLRTVTATEMDTSVWKRVAAALRSIAHLGGDEHHDRTVALIGELSAPVLTRVNQLLDEETDPSDVAKHRELRGVLFSLLGSAGEDEAVRTRAKELLAQEPGAAEDDAPLRAAAVEVVASCAGPEEHRDLERRWREAPTPQEELRYLHALVDTPDEALFRHALELSVTEVRTQNAPYLIRRALTHPTLSTVAWRFVEERWAEMVGRFPATSHPRMLEGIRSITDRGTAADAESFLLEHPLETGNKQVEQHIERMWVTVAAATRVRTGL